MNKEEILAASRKEYNNQDIAEIECLKQASKIAYIVGCLLCCIIAWVQWVTTKSINWGCWIVNFSILGTVFLVKSIKLKKKHEIMLTILYFIFVAFFTVGFFISLRG